MSDRDWQEKRFDRLEVKMEQQSETLSDMKVTLAEQHITLQEHMRRTAQNERLIYGLLGLALAGGAEKLGLFAKITHLLTG